MRDGAHLERLAFAPRPAGGAAEGSAREYCASRLRAVGFEVREAPFAYSAFPGRWGTPVSGVLAAAVIAGAGCMGLAGRAGVALGVLVAGAGAIAAAGVWMARWGVLRAPVLRRRGVNLVATRGEPAVWLVAHLDSKSQPVPIGARAAGIVATVLVWLAAAALAVAQLAGAVPPGATHDWWWVLGVAGITAALPVMLSVVGEDSDGAVDNASGVATVLLAAAAARPALPLGVLLTSAEELGLAGARAWAAHGGVAPATAINVDGVDDDGALTVMYTGRKPVALLAAVERAHAGGGIRGASPAGPAGPAGADVRLRVRRLLPGILVDAVALADRGWTTVTVSRATPGTLARIHTRRDSLAHLRGDGVAVAARLIATFIEETP